MANEYKERLRLHIEALEKSYDNIILMLNEDIEKDDEGKVKLKDSQREVYAKGIQKSSETAEYLLAQIKSKYLELEELNKPKDNPDKTPEGESETKSFPIEKKAENNLNNNLKDH